MYWWAWSWHRHSWSWHILSLLACSMGFTTLGFIHAVEEFSCPRRGSIQGLGRSRCGANICPVPMLFPRSGLLKLLPFKFPSFFNFPFPGVSSVSRAVQASYRCIFPCSASVHIMASAGSSTAFPFSQLIRSVGWFYVETVEDDGCCQCNYRAG